MSNILFVDTETTGFAKGGIQPNIVQLAWQVWNVETRTLVKSADHIIYPATWTIPEESTLIHGITHAHAQYAGIAQVVALNELQADLADCAILCAHNINFDLPVIAAAFRSENMDATRLEVIEKHCTMLASVSLCQLPGKFANSYKWPKLTELTRHLFGKELENAHNAAADVAATVECWFALKDKNVNCKLA